MWLTLKKNRSRNNCSRNKKNMFCMVSIVIESHSCSTWTCHLLPCFIQSLWPTGVGQFIFNHLSQGVVCLTCQCHGVTDNWSSFQGGHREGLGEGDNNKCHGCPQVAHWWLSCSCDRCGTHACPWTDSCDKCWVLFLSSACDILNLNNIYKILNTMP